LADKLIAFMQWEEGDSGLGDALNPTYSNEEAKSSAALSSATDTSLLLYQFRHFEVTRSSAKLLLLLIQSNQTSLSNWTLVWYILGCLRDCTLLPKEMVMDVDVDLLPPNIREDFEGMLLDLDRTTFDNGKPKAPKKVKRQSSSILSLQGLGEVFFGGGGGSDDGGGSRSSPDGVSDVATYHAELAQYKHVFKLGAVSARWDSGYEDVASPAPLSPVASGRSSLPTSPPQRGASVATATAAEVARSGSGSRLAAAMDIVEASESAQPLPVTGSAGSSRSGGGESVRKSTTRFKVIPPYSVVDGGMTMDDIR
jgi:hypothetical protein